MVHRSHRKEVYDLIFSPVLQLPILNYLWQKWAIMSIVKPGISLMRLNIVSKLNSGRHIIEC
jgi:hypothetical protein